MANHLAASREYQNASHIAYYLAVAGEADPQPLLEQTLTGNKTFFLPVIKKGNEVGLHFVKADKSTEFKANQYGIPEPVHQVDDEILPEQLDLIVTPLVSFDNKGNRIGMGGGFYDRTFAFKRESKARKPLLIGYAYTFQRSEFLKPEPWDVALDGIVTEEGFIRF